MATQDISPNLARNAGIALIVGGLFNILRVVPMRLSEGVTGENFPPQTVADVVLFAQIPVWEAVHALAIIAVILIIFGVSVLARMAEAASQAAIGMIVQIAITLSLTFYAIALVSDGLILPVFIQKLDHLGESGIADNGVMIEYLHLVATGLGGYSAALLLLSGIFLGLVLIRAFDAKVFGSIGVVVGVVSMLGYSSGLIGFDLSSSFMIVGPLTMSMFLYLVAIGAMLVRRASSLAVPADLVKPSESY